MKRTLLAAVILFCFESLSAQRPCSLPVFRQFDFWVGDWEVFGQKGKAGDSKISIILDSCIILEEWTSANLMNGLRYAGKSFNKYNKMTQQWQQTWVDNTGGSTEYMRGDASDGKIIFYADKNLNPQGKNYLRRLTFTKLNDDKVRQFAERSDDGGTTWTTEYDLEYRRKK